MTYYILLSNQLGLKFEAPNMAIALAHFQHWFQGFALSSSDHFEVTDISLKPHRGAQYFETSQVREISSFISKNIERPGGE